MEEPPIITSTQNPRIKSLIKLTKRRVRDEKKLFIIEGVRPIERAIMRGVKLEELYICPDLYSNDHRESQFVEDIKRSGIPTTALGREAFAKVAYRQHPEGLLAIAKQWSTDLDKLRLSKNPLIVVLEAVEKPGNLGTILRTADAVGADAVIVADGATDIFNPNVVRASTGTLFSVPIAVASTLDVIDFLSKNQIKTIATTPRATLNYTGAPLAGPAAIIMGAEDAGLSNIWIEKCDTPVKIPMLGLADSLNVSAATVVIAYEALRQRQEIK